MARSRRSSKPHTEVTDTKLADQYLAGENVLAMSETVVEVDDQCPGCYRGRIVDCHCNRCGLVIPSSGTLKEYAWGSRRSDDDEKKGD